MKKKKYLYLSVALLLFCIMFLLTDIYLIFLSPLDVGREVEKGYGDVILVLGGGLKKGYQIGFSTEERLNCAVDIYKQRKRLIVISDGSLYRGSPAIKKMVDFLVRKGVARQDIKYEGKSQTTYENLLYAQKLSRSDGFKEIVVCTSPYHQKRSLLILDYLKIKNFKIAKMKNSEIYRAHTVKQRLRNIRLIFREYFAILKFKLLKK